MSIQFVLLPLFVEVLLTFGVMFGMMYFRTSSLQRGETRLRDIALREPNWPVRATQFGYAFANQFELPVLFYVLTILVTNNNVLVRGAFYGLGAIILVIIWAIYIVRILLALP